MTRKTFLSLVPVLLVFASYPVFAQSDRDEPSTEDLRKQIAQLEDRLQKTRNEMNQQNLDGDVHVGGAVRFQYAYRGYDETSRNRTGAMELDTVRLNFDGQTDNVELSAEYRFYEYMDVVHHAWVGHDFTDQHSARIGVTRTPFGILPFSSHSYFFSGNYYLGLEDDYDFGLKSIHQSGPWDLRFAFFKNDEIQFGNEEDRYSYDVLRDTAPTAPAGAGNPLEENNTLHTRIAYTVGKGSNYTTELGVSGLRGSLYDGSAAEQAGTYHAGALHLNGRYGPWNVMLQYTRQEYDLDNGETHLGSGAYAARYGLPAEANTYLTNLAYNLPVELGPISKFRFYNDFTYVDEKPEGVPASWMNVLGTSISAGDLFTYVDLVRAQNHPFIGGDLLGDGEPESRFNVNFGYYF